MAETEELSFTTANGVNVELYLTFNGGGSSGTVATISGMVGTTAVTGLDSGYEADNKISSTYPYVDRGGLSFDAGGEEFNLWYDENITFYGSDAGEVTDVSYAPACYCDGTRILTDRGEVAVEALAIDDRVVTALSGVRPIRWIGHRRYGKRFANNNPDLLPICFKAGSLAENVPTRDLYVSPEHAMYIWRRR